MYGLKTRFKGFRLPSAVATIANLAFWPNRVAIFLRSMTNVKCSIIYTVCQNHLFAHIWFAKTLQMVSRD